MAALINASEPVGIERVKRGAPFTTITRSVLLLPISSTICGSVASGAIKALLRARLSGSKAITLSPIDSNISSFAST